jgi:hypothetical protein
VPPPGRERQPRPLADGHGPHEDPGRGDGLVVDDELGVPVEKGGRGMDVHEGVAHEGAVGAAA